MPTRKNMRKRTRRRNISLAILGLIIVMAIIGGVIIHNQQVVAQNKARIFARTHFNPQVQIYGVQVGKLTVAQATSKINRAAANHVQIKHDRVVLSHNPAVQTIAAKQVQSYFAKQHTTLPTQKKFVFQSAALTTAKKKLTKVNHAVVDYQLNGHHYQLKADALIDRASYEDGHYHIQDLNRLRARLKEIDHQQANLHKSYRFAVPAGKRVKGHTITVTNKTYGWAISLPRTLSAIERAFINGQKVVKGRKYLHGAGSNNYAHGYDQDNHGIGPNYVVVSIKKQELWVIKHHHLVVHLPNVVTGTYLGGKGNRTPTGVWYVMYKQSPSVLRGKNDDGTKYKSKVKYWMPFTLSGCGLHDAWWRSDWSKTAYLQGGSHGCVNIQPSQIRSVWDNVRQDEAVIIYN